MGVLQMSGSRTRFFLSSFLGPLYLADFAHQELRFHEHLDTRSIRKADWSTCSFVEEIKYEGQR
jgi:hypothetical protein